MEYLLSTLTRGKLALTTLFHENASLQRDHTLYKFVWVKRGSVTVEVDRVPMTLGENEIIPLTPLHKLEVKELNGEYLTLAFNCAFYCILGHDNEVLCNGFLFHGSSDVMRLQLQPAQAARFNRIVEMLQEEFDVRDHLQEEMLRILLKQFIIGCTRIARESCHICDEKEKSFDLIRRYYILVEQHYREMKQVSEYAEKLNRSPKTLSNLFASYGYPSPLRILHQRVEAEARRQLIYSQKSVKEIGDYLGFDDQTAFNRFFKKMTGEGVFDFRNRERNL